MAVKTRGGRPKKFDVSSRVVTITLPERTLKNLESIDRDRARAIVKAVDSTLYQDRESDQPLVDLVEVAPGIAIIIVGPSSSLRSVHWLRMVEITPERFLLVIQQDIRAEELELIILDMLDMLPSDDHYERPLLEQLRKLIRSSRHESRIQQYKILMISVNDIDSGE
jgi:hypothetical protein